MSKGKFEPGKRVLLINGLADWAKKYNRTLGTLESIGLVDHDGNNWFIEEIHDEPYGAGVRVIWRQIDMILLDPDETPEQSAEAMRNLCRLPQKVTA